MSSIEQQIADLKKQKDRIEEQYRAAKKEARYSSDEVVKVQKKQQFADLKAQYEAISEKIKLLESGQLTVTLTPDEIRTKLSDIWRKKIHLIDYEVPEETFRAVAKKLNDENAALLLIQQSELKMARLYWQRVHKIMEDEGGTCNPIRERFDDVDIVTPDEYTNRLLKRFGGDEHEADKLAVIIRKLLDHAQPGQVIPMVIECEDIGKDFLDWLAHQFWKKLLEELEHHWGIRIVCVVLVAEDIDSDFDLVPCQTIDEFSCESYFEIVLHNWEKQQIIRWFRRHDVIAPLIDFGVEPASLREIIPQVIKKTYKLSNGTPVQIYNNLHGTAVDYIVERIQNAAV
jgi:hypothetical protein